VFGDGRGTDLRHGTSLPGVADVTSEKAAKVPYAMLE
jgi:hypothetical protein